MSDMQQPNNFTGNNAPVIELLRSLVQAINNLNTTIEQVFPQQVAVSATAGSATGTYGTVTGSDGSIYKIALLAES